MLEHVEVILYVFLLFYLLILLYDFKSLYSKKSQLIRDSKKKKFIIDWIQEREKTTDEKTIKTLNNVIIKKLRKLSYLSNLGDLFEKNIKINGVYIRNILNKKHYQVIFAKLSVISNKKETLFKTYYAYILSFINFNNDEIHSFLCNCLITDSISTVENALLSFYKIGNSKAIVEAFKIISKEHIYYSNKLISDGMFKYNGSKQELCNELYKNFDEFNDEIKIGILTFFRSEYYQIADKLLEKLKHSRFEKEVELATIRYFSKIYSKEAVDLFILRIDNNYYNDYDYDVVMIQVLNSLEKFDEKVINILKKSLANPNYYVRYNAAKALNDKINLSSIDDIDDKFTKDMLDYFISQEV